MHQLIEREAAIGRVFDKTVEARGNINDVPDFIPWEPSLLLLRIHNQECTWAGRSVLRQVDVDDVETGQPNRAVPITQVGRLSLVPGDTRTTLTSVKSPAHVALHGGHFGKASHDDTHLALHPILLYNARPAL